ncbi:MAG: hypothetical protein ACP5M8_07975 [Caldisphaera sp.]
MQAEVDENGQESRKEIKAKGLEEVRQVQDFRAGAHPASHFKVDALPPPYKVKEKGSVGRPSANPRTIVKVLLFKALNGLSYFSAFSEL